MSRLIQIAGMAVPHDLFHLAWDKVRGSTRLFSSALFCLWLSTASLVVWVDFGKSPAEQVAMVAEDTVPDFREAAPTDAIKHH